MLNPETKMQAQLTTAKVLQRDLRQTVNAKMQAIETFYSAKQNAAEQKNEPAVIKHATQTPFIPKRIIDDEEKERELLQMAKAEYQSYEDVARFAKALNLRAGIVYLTLKHHNFIKQNETTQYRVLDAYYRNNGHLKAITEETGLTVWIVAKTLEQLGLSPNWASYRDRAESGNKGGVAEEEFRRLVPSAVDMNMNYKMNNPVFDFVINEKTIDVKSSSLVGKSSVQQYGMRIRSHPEDENLPDFFCLFCLIDKTKPLTAGNYHILLIPKEVLPANNERIAIAAKGRQANSAMYWDFEVEPSALASILGDI